MTHKVESAVDLDSGAILSIEVQPSDKSDASAMAAHFETAAQMAEFTAEQAARENAIPEEDRGEKKASATTVIAAADKGYHKNEELLKRKPGRN